MLLCFYLITKRILSNTYISNISLDFNNSFADYTIFKMVKLLKNIKKRTFMCVSRQSMMSPIVRTHKGLKYQLSGHAYRQNNICFFLSSFAL